MASPRKTTPVAATKPAAPANTDLEEIKLSAFPDTAAVDFIIVAIPWLMKADKFAICNDTCGILPNNANVFGFHALETVDVNFSWQNLLEYGKKLVKILDSHRKNQGLNPRPLVLIAHSLAGFVTKQCMIVADVQSDRYRSLKDAFFGTVFLGCPHAATQERRGILYEKSCAILRLGGLSSRRISGLLEAGHELTQLCKQFDEIYGALNVVSLYEQKHTGLPRRFQKPDFQYLVDKQLARTKAVPTKEVMACIDTDHLHLPSLRNSTPPYNPDADAIRAISDLLKPLEKAPTSSQESVPLQPLVEVFKVGQKIPDLPCFIVDMSRKKNVHFTGRRDVLDMLAQKLLNGRRQVVILQGFGGLGKSEVALEFVHRYQDDFDAIFWVQADDVSKMRQEFGNLAARIGLQDPNQPKDPFTSRELVKSWLMKPVGRLPGGVVRANWLIVFDGADSPDVLSEFESIYGQGSILVTGRDPRTAHVFSDLASRSHSQAHDKPLTIKMHPLEVEEAATVLKRLAKVPLDEEESMARKIVTLLDGWPLAISQMAGIIRKQSLTLGQFHAQYNNVAIRSNLQAQVSMFTPESSRETMVSSMRMAKLSSEATALLRVFAMLDPDCIQEELFFDVPADLPLVGFPSSPGGFEKARDELLGSSIVELNKDKQELWLHRVLQDTVRGSCITHDYDCSFRTAAMLVKKKFHPPGPGVRDSLKLWEPCAVFLRHVVHLQQIYETQAKIDLTTTQKTIQPCFDFAWLLSETATFQRNLGNTPGLKSTCLLALSICHGNPGLPKGDTFTLRGELYHSLGAWANETNHPHECLDYNSRYLDLAESALREGAVPNERTAMAYNQYGTGKMMIREYGDAMDAFQKSIHTYASLPRTSKCSDSLPKVNLATAKWLVGDYEAADALLEEGRMAREEAFGYEDEESFRTGRFYHTLGNLKWSQGRPKVSEIWHRRALKQYLSVVGPMHHRTADVRHKVAEHCLRNGDLVNAGALIDQALMSWQLDAPSFKHETARTTWLKARVKGRLGNPDEARQLREQAYFLRRQLEPGDTRPCEELKDEDFDDLVAFWSR